MNENNTIEADPFAIRKIGELSEGLPERFAYQSDHASSFPVADRIPQDSAADQKLPTYFHLNGNLRSAEPPAEALLGYVRNASLLVKHPSERVLLLGLQWVANAFALPLRAVGGLLQCEGWLRST